MAAFERSQPVLIRNPNATRPWQHVLEPLRGYLTLAERLHAEGPAFAEGWNFGPHSDDARPVGWIVAEMARLWPGEAAWQIDAGTHSHEANYLKLDISKAASQLGWHPSLRLRDALQLVIDWSQGRRTGMNAHELTLGQIAHYQKLNHDLL